MGGGKGSRGAKEGAPIPRLARDPHPVAKAEDGVSAVGDGASGLHHVAIHSPAEMAETSVGSDICLILYIFCIVARFLKPVGCHCCMISQASRNLPASFLGTVLTTLLFFVLFSWRQGVSVGTGMKPPP